MRNRGLTPYRDWRLSHARRRAGPFTPAATLERSLRQANVAEDLRETGIAAQRVEPRFPLAIDQPGGTFGYSFVQPGEGGILVAQRCINQRDVKRRSIGLLCSRDKSLQNR